MAQPKPKERGLALKEENIAEIERGRQKGPHASRFRCGGWSRRNGKAPRRERWGHAETAKLLVDNGAIEPVSGRMRKASGSRVRFRPSMKPTVPQPPLEREREMPQHGAPHSRRHVREGWYPTAGDRGRPPPGTGAGILGICKKAVLPQKGALPLLAHCRQTDELKAMNDQALRFAKYSRMRLSVFSRTSRSMRMSQGSSAEDLKVLQILEEEAPGSLSGSRSDQPPLLWSRSDQQGDHGADYELQPRRFSLHTHRFLGHATGTHRPNETARPPVARFKATMKLTRCIPFGVASEEQKVRRVPCWRARARGTGLVCGSMPTSSPTCRGASRIDMELHW